MIAQLVPLVQPLPRALLLPDQRRAHFYLHLIQVARVIFQLPQLPEIPLVCVLDKGINCFATCAPEPVGRPAHGLLALLALVLLDLVDTELHQCRFALCFWWGACFLAALWLRGGTPAEHPQWLPFVIGRFLRQAVLAQLPRRRSLVALIFIVTPPWPRLGIGHGSELHTRRLPRHLPMLVEVQLDGLHQHIVARVAVHRCHAEIRFSRLVLDGSLHKCRAPEEQHVEPDVSGLPLVADLAHVLEQQAEHDRHQHGDHHIEDNIPGTERVDRA
mmetsp:Transcript_71642/g.207471  ORF Transcript_71642/g.207471 Transcript_71642/m.207471 type:complete len:273 (-) Transcript_71642:95-913(-)